MGFYPQHGMEEVLELNPASRTGDHPLVPPRSGFENRDDFEDSDPTFDPESL
jgi:hypothetical protein